MLARTPSDEVKKPVRRKKKDKGLKAVFRALKKQGDTQASLARYLKVTRQAISGWSKVPVEHVIEIEDLLGVPAHVQRADVFRAPKRQQEV